jgi:hypothetical protein
LFTALPLPHLADVSKEAGGGLSHHLDYISTPSDVVLDDTVKCLLDSCSQREFDVIDFLRAENIPGLNVSLGQQLIAFIDLHQNHIDVGLV